MRERASYETEKQNRQGKFIYIAQL